MKWASKAVNGLLGQFDLRLSRASSFNKLLSELGRQHEQLEEYKGRHEQWLNLSQVRWRADEPDAGLTWGVPMSGDAFVRVLWEHFTFEDSTIVEIGPGYGRILDALLKRSTPFRRTLGWRSRRHVWHAFAISLGIHESSFGRRTCLAAWI